ncbi:Tar ligand binding domain-containing protein, partial [Paenibacillus sp. TRM 82003]|uniref:Tar ligand binding domain-containing protein n=1 Tax=Kineococcus sp. TRM81007 TaxID=2925831 RepID=UPI001F5A15AE
MLTRLRGLNVASKLFAGFGVVCLLLAVVVGVGISRLDSSQANTDAISTRGMASVQTVGEVKAAFLRMRLSVTSAALAPTPEKTTEQLEIMAGDDEAYDQAWQAYLATSPAATAEDHGVVEDLLAQYRTVREGLVTAAEANDTQTYIAVRDAEVTPLSQQITGQLDAISQTETRAAVELAEKSDSDFHAAVTLLLTIGALAVAVAVVVAVAVSRSIARPLAKTLTVVQGLATGRLDQRVDYVNTDEVGRLAGAVDTTMENLTGTVRRITASAQTLAASSEELSTVADGLSAGAVQSSSQSQVVSAATEEISTSIGTVAAAGEEMTAAIREIASSTAEASQVASAAVASASEASAILERLSASSREIGDVVKLITS